MIELIESNIRQKTIINPIIFEGIGLHKGIYSKIQLLPEKPNKGIWIEFPNGTSQKVTPKLITNTLHNITLETKGHKLMTVEHLFSVFAGLGIDNIRVKVIEGEEIPILDGSAKLFLKGILDAGLVEQSENKMFFYIKRTEKFEKNDKYLIAIPSETLQIDYEIDFKVIGKMKLHIEITEENFIKDIANARTFGFIEDKEKLKKAGLALGASLENVHVYSIAERRSINEERYLDEPVRHKILDLLGAIAILSPNIKGKFIAKKSGHYIDTKLIQKLLHRS